MNGHTKVKKITKSVFTLSLDGSQYSKG